MKQTEHIGYAKLVLPEDQDNRPPVSEYFGSKTFNKVVMREKLPHSAFEKLERCIKDGAKLDIDTANIVAHAMKEWAMENGATHFGHWFQPMTGATAEKHDSFIEFSGEHQVIERFSGEQLVQGEPDASSFPSGGIRATFEARGYTAWDMSSPAFLRSNGKGVTLTIPSAFISYTGDALDKKTPLLRSIRAVCNSTMRLLKLLGNTTSSRAIVNLGPEQEYFLIDRRYYSRRQDLVLTDRTLFGSAPAKGQELDDQYFGSIKERIQSFMNDLDFELHKLGIPAKTRHNEVAPSQFEIAPIFEEANLAVDHNQLLLDTIKKVARRQYLTALLHEKPFSRVNGSGKHVNWSISTDDGINLLKPGNSPAENLQFLIFLVSIIKGVHNNADILRSTVASIGNDHRLGANEAPPAIISIFLGDQLLGILESIEKNEAHQTSDEDIIDLGISSLPLLSKDDSDRNRTSPFAFTGNKFEFRAVGSSQSISFPSTVLNTIVAQAIDQIIDSIEKRDTGDLRKAIFEVLREEITLNKAVLFSGDNYTKEWHDEAERRGLPNNKNTPSALRALDTDKARELFGKYGVLSPVELHSRYEIKLETYATKLDIEAKAFVDMVSCQVLPAAYAYQKAVAESIKAGSEFVAPEIFEPQKKMLEDLAGKIGCIQGGIAVLKDLVDQSEKIEDPLELAEFCCDRVKVLMDQTREVVDDLETIVDNELWPVPKYWEMLFVN